MENFLLNFAAQIDISKININPGVKRTLSALTKSSKGTNKIKQEIEFDVKSVGKVSDIGGDLIKDLQKSLSKIKISPTTILNQKELSSVTGRLEQIPVILKAINAQMQFILAKPELIPNAVESLGKLATLKRSLKDIRQETEKGIRLQFSSELAPVRQLDALISSARSKTKELQAQLSKIKEGSKKPGEEVGIQTKKALEAKAKIDTLRSERRSAKSLSADEITALKGQEKEALGKLNKAIEARRKAKPITTEIQEISKKEKDLQKPIFSAQTALTEKQRAAQVEIESANKRLESERQGLELLKKQTAEIAAQQALSTKAAQKKLAPLEKAKVESETKKTEAGARLQSIEDRQRQIIIKEQADAKKFLEGDFAKAEAEFKAKAASIRNVKKREELKQQILGPLEDRRLAAETALNFSGFQPKGAEFAKLQKEKEAAAKAFTEASSRQAAAQKTLDAAKEELVAKSKSNAASKELELQQKKVAEAAQKVLEIEKRTAAEVAKLKGEYDALTSALSKSQQKRAELEKQKSEGKTGLESFDAKIAAAKKTANEISAKILLAGEDPKKSISFNQARDELRTAIQKRNEALQQQKTVDQEILSLERQIAAQQKLQNDLEIQQNSLVASMSGNLKQDLNIRKQIEESINRAVKSEENLQKRIGEAFAKSGKKYEQPDARKKALERLGVTETEIAAPPTADLLSKIKASRFGAAQSRGEDLSKALASISSDERARILEEKFNKALQNLKISQEKRSKTSLAKTSEFDRVNLFNQEKENLIYKAFGKSAVGIDIAAGSSISSAASTLQTEDAVKTLRKIQEIIKEQNEEKKKQIQLDREISNQEKNRIASNRIIEDLVRQEMRSRAKMVETVAKQGVNLDPKTGLATRSVRAGETAQPPVRLLEPITSVRENILKRLGTTEEEVSRGETSVRVKITNKSKEIALEREKEYRSAQITANRTVAADRLIVNLRELIARDLEISRRNAVLTGAPAPTLAASSAKILGQTLGSGVSTISEARSRFQSAQEGDAVATLNRVTEARRRQRQEIVATEQAEARAVRAAREVARTQQQETDRRARNLERVNALIERSALLYERQARTVNALSRTGIPGVPSRQIDRNEINRTARATIVGGVDLSTLSSQELENAANLGRRRLRDQQAALREFNSTVKDVSNGSRSAFELISKYSDNAFDRFGARVGLATERLAAYVTSGAGLYTIISQTRQAIIETALLEKEITNIQQIFDSLSSEVRFGDAVSNSFDIALKKATDLKSLILDLSQITSIAPLEIAQASKTLAAAGFGGQGKPGFEETIRAVSFATLGPSFGNSQEVIDGLTAALNQFNRSLSETPYILGIVNQFSKDYAVEAQDLFEAIKRGGGSFAAVGGNLEDFLKLVTITREQTREAAPVVGTFLKTLSSRLFTPKTDKLLANLGLDPNTLLDPYERLLAISKKLEKSGGAAGNVSILSNLIDTRQTGRLFALLEKLRNFDEEFKNQDIAGQAASSIVEDAKKRLDDIGPTIDRIKISYFKFIEGIYNNPATKALLDIPSGLLSSLSELPNLSISAGGANFKAANVINPLVQATALTGLSAVIRGSIRAYQQNQLTVRSNTGALDNLRQAVGRLTAQMSGRQTLQPDAGNAAPRGQNTLLGTRTIAALGIATAVPAIVNSILPATGLDTNTQQITSSTVQGGVDAVLIASLLGATTALTGAVGLLGAAVSYFAVATESVKREKELSKLETQSRIAAITQQFESSAKAGRIVKTSLSVPDKDLSNLIFTIGSIRKNENELQKNADKDRLNLLRGEKRFTSQDFINELLGIDVEKTKNRKELRQKLILESVPLEINQKEIADSLNLKSIEDKIKSAGQALIEEQNRFKLAKSSGSSADLIASEKSLSEITKNISDLEKRRKSQTETIASRRIERLKSERGFDVLEAERVLEGTSETIANALENILSVRMMGLEDTFENRQKAIRDVAEEFSSNVSIDGLRFSSSDVEKALGKFLELNNESRNFTKSLGSFKFSIKSLYEEAEVAGKIINSLGSSLAKSFDIQNIGIQRLLDAAKRNLPNVENTRRLTTNPFVAESIQSLSGTASINTITKTIEGLSTTKPINIISPEVKKLTSIIDGFLSEVASADSNVREDIIRAFSEERLKVIGGTQQETIIDTEEGKTKPRSVLTTNEVLGQQIESTFSILRDLGVSSRELFDIIRSSGPLGVQPFDLRELGKSISSGETGAGLKILGLQGAEEKLREQANLLIERQNLSIQSQIQASEALIASIIERRNNELDLAKATRDNALTIVSFKTNLGLISKEFGIELAGFIKRAEIDARGGPADIGGISDLINSIKFAQNEINKIIRSGGSSEGTNIEISSNLSRLISNINNTLPEFGLNSYVRTNEIGSAISDLAASRAILERSIQEVFTNLQDKFQNFGDTVDSIGAKIQAQRGALDNIITKLFSGNRAERGINEAALLSGQRNAARIVAAASAVEPKFKTQELGQSQIIASDAIARAVAPIIQSLSERDLLSLREYLNIASTNQLDSGATGEQVKAAIEAGFASILPTFGIKIGQADIAQNVDAGRVAINEAAKVAEQLKQAGLEQANIMSANLNLVSNEVNNLSAAIASIPKQIDIVIKGINNVTVDFDINNVQKSMASIGSEVYKQVLQTLGEAFRRAGIPIESLR